MSFDKLKNLFSRTFDPKEEDSLISQATNFISSSRRTIIENPTAEFESYLSSLPLQELRQLRTHKRSSRTASLKPQLVKNCYENVPAVYFEQGYQVKGELFVRNRKETSQRTFRMHQWLDEVELCLFNQISSRFDQILSVLRTIESLQCVVVFNANRLKQIRQSNMELVKRVSQRHINIVTLLKRQERLKATLAVMAQVKAYHSFLQLEQGELRLQRSNSQHYQAITEVRANRQIFFQLAATRHFEERVEEVEATLKKSFSDSVNDAIFRYVTEIIPYESSFWEKKFLGRGIFEEQEKEAEGTVILDESMLVEEEGGHSVKVNTAAEEGIIQSVLNGWREGEYAIGSLRAATQKFLRERHLRFQADCRNYIFQTHIRLERPKIQNPSLANLLRQATVPFCAKTFLYYTDMFRGALTRGFSVIGHTLRSLIEEKLSDLTMEDQGRLQSLVEGLFSWVGWLFRAIYQKMIQVIDLKEVHEAMELSDFKQIINVFETEQDFIQKTLRRLISIPIPEGHCLSPLIAAQLNRFDLSLITQAKKERVQRFLNSTHRYILQNQLRESFENEIWQATDIPTFYYDSLHYLITGESLNLRRNKNHSVRHNLTNNFESSVFIDRMGEPSIMESNKGMGNFRIIRSEIIIEGRTYKVTETLLLLLQIIEDYLHLAQFYPFVSEEVGMKVYELLKAYNTSSHQLIILGGAVKLGRIKTKNITAKHLALDSLCLSFLIYILNCIAQRIPVYELDRLRKDLQGHQETAVKKLSSILVGKINQALPQINLNATPSKGTEAIVNNTKVLHDILADFYTKDVLSKIFTSDNVQAYLKKLKGMEIRTKLQAQSLKDDLNFYFHELKFLDRIVPDYQSLRLEGEDLIRTKFEDL